MCEYHIDEECQQKVKDVIQLLDFENLLLPLLYLINKTNNLPLPFMLFMPPYLSISCGNCC